MFAKEVGFKRMKIWTNSHGTRLITFYGNNALRRLVTGTNYGAAGLAAKNISIVESGVQSVGKNAAQGAKALGSKTGLIGMVFIAVVDIGAWLADPSCEKELNQLLTDLIVDLSVAAVGAVVGAVIAGVAVGFISAPVVVVVGAGILLSAIAGWAIGKVADAVGLREKLKEAMDNADTYSTLQNEMYEGMMTAP